MKQFFTAILIIATSLQLYAQTENPQPLEIKTSFWKGMYMEQNGQQLTLKQAQDLMESVPLAFEEMKRARTNNTFATIFGMAGGFMVGWPLGTAIAGGDPEWVMAGIGAGLIGVSIPFASGTSKRAKNAVDAYNENLGHSTKNTLNTNFKFSGNAVSVVISF